MELPPADRAPSSAVAVMSDIKRLGHGGAHEGLPLSALADADDIVVEGNPELAVFLLAQDVRRVHFG